MTSHLESGEPIAIAADVLGVEGRDALALPIGTDRGVFSVVWRVVLAPTVAGVRSVVVKMPRPGPNGEAARRTGAYGRERVFYHILGHGPLPVPTCYGIVDTDTGPAFVLEDLTDRRLADQIVGLDPSDTDLVVDALVGCHKRLDVAEAKNQRIRSNTASAFADPALAAGLERLAHTVRPTFARLVERKSSLVATCSGFAGPVLCHGDPRADNVAFRDEGHEETRAAVLFDWQQIAVQAGEADLAWLLATSMDPARRLAIEETVVASYAHAMDRSTDEAWHRYRTALVLPGLAVLLLVQRRASGRLAELVDLSVERIGAAVADHLVGP